MKAPVLPATKPLFFLLIAIITCPCCAFFPPRQTEGKKNGKPPDWVFYIPPNDTDYFFVIGVGSDPSGNAVRALAASSRNAVSEILKKIGMAYSDDLPDEKKVAIAGLEKALDSVADKGTVLGERSVCVIDLWTDTSRPPKLDCYILVRLSVVEFEALKKKVAPVIIP